jgi:hypothetical protein
MIFVTSLPHERIIAIQYNLVTMEILQKSIMMREALAVVFKHA